ncbi:MAG: hypothetical protein KR126chlam1_00222 [Chlamydiae bacterium]|nr:hypothetical protein [Chlamydiota bacterium]
MPNVNKKYQEDFDALCRDWERLVKRPSNDNLAKVMQDLQQMRRDLENMNF